MSKRLATHLRCNDQIRLSPIRLIGASNEQIGIIETDEARRMAREAQLDLVEVAPKERPPVCRIMDYGKYKYSQKKHQKKPHEQQLKEVRMRPKTDSHDRTIKMNRALRFLKKGDKVQFTMMFRGRERAHREVGIRIFRTVIEELGERVKVERPPGMDGRHMIMIVSPNKAVLLADEKEKLEAKSKPPVEKDAAKSPPPAGEQPVQEPPTVDAPADAEQQPPADTGSGEVARA